MLKELIEHHVKEEEEDMFPKVQKKIDAAELERLGARMQAMFEQAVELGLDALVTGSGAGPRAREQPRERPAPARRQAGARGGTLTRRMVRAASP